jgi:subtilase family serine protease
MQGSHKFLRLVREITASLLVLALVVGTFILFGRIGRTAISVASSQTTQASIQSGFVAHPVNIKPITKKLGDASKVRLRTLITSGTNKVLFPCQSDTNPTPLLCYGPGQIAQAYGIQNLSQQHITGAGSTIVIVDAYGSPTIQADLQCYRT